MPLSINTALTSKKALNYLWRAQTESTVIYRNQARKPSHDYALRKAYEDFECDLYYGLSQKGEIRTTSCALRDPYTAGQLSKMLSFCWRMLPVIQVKGVRKYNSSNRFPYIRENFCLKARHHMILRDEDLRHLNLSDCFPCIHRNKAHGSQMALGLAICLSRGKTNKKGQRHYATAFRHRNFLRCTVSGFAFLMFERFEVCQTYRSRKCDSGLGGTK